MTSIVVPSLGESVSEATIAKWLKKEGDAVRQDEPLVELETDKVTVEVNAPSAGTLVAITAQAHEDELQRFGRCHTDLDQQLATLLSPGLAEHPHEEGFGFGAPGKGTGLEQAAQQALEEL